MHTVFSGDGEMDVSPAAAAPAPTPAPVVPQEVALHNATCDLCDSRIRGDRYVSRGLIAAAAVAKPCYRNVWNVQILTHAARVSVSRQSSIPGMALPRLQKLKTILYV